MSLNRSTSRAAMFAWLFLVAASLMTWFLIEDKSLQPAWAVSPILVIAVLKVRVIALHYMELKRASQHWRLAFELWPVIAASLILALWFYGGAGCPAIQPAPQPVVR